jgi:hypothetical protein
MIHPKLIGDFFAKFHFSLVAAQLAGNLVDGIKNGKKKDDLMDTKKISNLVN